MSAGILLPLISSFIIGTPVIYPVAVYMAFELAAYGILCGLLARRLNIILQFVAVPVIVRTLRKNRMIQ